MSSSLFFLCDHVSAEVFLGEPSVWVVAAAVAGHNDLFSERESRDYSLFGGESLFSRVEIIGADAHALHAASCLEEGVFVLVHDEGVADFYACALDVDVNADVCGRECKKCFSSGINECVCWCVEEYVVCIAVFGESCAVAFERVLVDELCECLLFSCDCVELLCLVVFLFERANFYFFLEEFLVGFFKFGYFSCVDGYKVYACNADLCCAELVYDEGSAMVGDVVAVFFEELCDDCKVGLWSELLE